MILITGGACQGKRTFAKKMYQERKSSTEKAKEAALTEKEKGVERVEEAVLAEGGHSTLEQLKQGDIISDFHLWIRKLMKEGQDPYPMMEEVLKDNPEVFILLNQLGCGIVPMEKFEREYREITGRIGCLLAERAESVYLVTCGIPRKIK